MLGTAVGVFSTGGTNHGAKPAHHGASAMLRVIRNCTDVNILL